MDELINLFEQMLSKLDDISTTLNHISYKLSNIDGTYGIDDIANKIDEAVDDIVGDTRYNLTDIHSKLSDIDLTISMKD